VATQKKEYWTIMAQAGIPNTTALGHSRPGKSALAPPFVGCAPNNDRDYCGATSAATCQPRHHRFSRAQYV